MKLESLVIVDQNATVNTFSGLVLTKSAPGRLICQTVKIRSSFLSIKERSQEIVNVREEIGRRILRQTVA